MLKYISLFLMVLIIGCSNPNEPIIFENVEVSIDNPEIIRLTDDWQTIHILRGNITTDGIPFENVKFYWESNLSWTLGDTLGVMYRRGWTDDLEYRYFDTIVIAGAFGGEIVPTINLASYSKSNGDFAIQLSPVRSMRGDTLNIRYEMWWDRTFIGLDSLSIILE